MKVADFLSASQSKWPYQNITVRPVTHYDDLEKDGTHDFIVTMIVGNKQLAYRVSLETALEIDNWIVHALRDAVAKGKPVSLYTGKPEEEHEVEASR